MDIKQLSRAYLDYLADLKMHHVGIVLDGAFKLIQVTGDTARYGLADLGEGDDLRPEFPFLESHPPGSESKPEIVEFLELGDGIACHVHYFIVDQQRILFLFDASDDYQRRFELQQQANELDLLTRRQEQLMAELRETQRKLEHADRMKGRFIAGMSHEYRIPLTAILGHLDRLKSPDEFDISHVKSAERSARHLLSLINNVLDQAQISEESLILDPVPTDLRDVLADIRSVFVPTAEGKGLGLYLHVDEAVPERLQLDGLRLRQIVINLLGNALKFTDHGEVGVDAHWQDEQLSIVVYDTGPGIAEEAQETLFSPFSRDAESARGKPGTGLGLSISAGLVKLMGGDVELDSALGSGSRFRVLLPAPKLVTADAESLETEIRGRRVLMVEDDEDVLNLMSVYLEEAGLRVEAEPHSPQALENALLSPPDCIVLDMEMPELKGDELSRLLRERGVESPIIVMSALSGRDDLQRALESGANAYLMKPVDPSYLVATVAKLIGQTTREVSHG